MKSEKEKMLAGEVYHPSADGILPEERRRAKRLCHEYNRLGPDDLARREEIMRELLGRTGGQFLVEPPFWCDYGYNISIGEDFYSNHNLVILDCAKVSFGAGVMVGPGCGFYSVNHPLDPALRSTWVEYALPITVGDGVWFGGNVTVLPGVTIGDGAVVGAGSVVTRDVPAGTVAAGNPCRVIRPSGDRDRKA
ncbi:MAG: sugar O-acetyltransferase [Deltaproteobacteria bacterium]|jgi:acetyltransferase-like isoleucine patch superfamily enzyme|nr:sugar O-acetyltransferase [Deltaproteobacteria bacterium]